MPNGRVWVLECDNATYRVRLIPDMAAQIERLRLISAVIPRTIASPFNVVGVLLLVGFFGIFTTVLAGADLSRFASDRCRRSSRAFGHIHEVVSPMRCAGTFISDAGSDVLPATRYEIVAQETDLS